MQKLGTHARTGLTLIACILLVCVPSGALHLNLCDCNGLLVQTRGAPCPCESEPTECADSCSDAHPSDCASGCEDGCTDPDDEDSCCSESSIDFVYNQGGGTSKWAPVDDTEPEPEPLFFPYGLVAGESQPWPVVVRATGPPVEPFIRRVLAERAATVLLI